jgi:hypothetical protein
MSGSSRQAPDNQCPSLASSRSLAASLRWAKLDKRRLNVSFNYQLSVAKFPNANLWPNGLYRAEANRG